MAQDGRVVVGVSGSLHSLGALHRAADEARRRDRELVAVLAWAPPYGEVAPRRAPWPLLPTAWEKPAAACLEQAFRSAFGGFPPGVRVCLVTARGEPGTVLTELADQPDDLLVIGAGRQGRLRLFHAGVSRYCLAHARCDVLAVPPSELMRCNSRIPRDLDGLNPRVATAESGAGRPAAG